MSSKLGIVFTFNQLPDVMQFPFVINNGSMRNFVRKGLFVCTTSTEGFLIGVIEKIVLLNEYFSDALTIKSYNSDKNPNILKGLFPSEDFEFAIAIVKCLGVIEFTDEKRKKIKKIHRMSYPASPGSEVFLLAEDILSNFLGLDINHGLNLGQIKVSRVNAKINLDRLLNKHFAILSISGGGKSYLSSIIIEELLAREPKYGCPAIVLIDVHGEYTYLKEIPELKEKVNLHDISYFQIAVPRLNAWSFKKYQDQISYVQIRELSRYIQKLRKKGKETSYSLRDIINLIEEETDGNKSTKQALISWLLELEHLSVFGPQENPNIPNLVKPSKITIFNLQNEINIRKKQIVVDYLCNRLFYLRRMNKITPFLLIIEEAHQFVPEAAHSKGISKNIIETIAREGRKFMSCLCLISQRPKKLSATALSQCNSKLILNIKNPYDIKHLMDSSEAITKEFGNMISSLSVGEMLLMGNATNYPIFIEVRERKYKSQVEKLSFTKICSDWQKANLS